MSSNDEKILKALEDLQADVKGLAGDVAGIKVDVSSIKNVQRKQGKHLEALDAGQKTLESGQQALDLKVEAIHNYQKQAHTEIMEHLIDSNEANGQAQQQLEQEIEVIKKHVGLPTGK